MLRLLWGFLRSHRFLGMSMLLLLRQGLGVFGNGCKQEDVPTFAFSEVYEELLGHAVVYKCKEGAVRVPGKSSTVFCVRGAWAAKGDPCQAVICANPVVQDGEELSGLRDSYTYGNSVILECKTGYFMIGKPYIFCEKNGTWVPNLPSCKKITPYICGAPIVLEGHIYPLQSEYKFGELIDVYCNQNYSFIDETIKMTAQCQGYNQWDPSINLCLAKTSPDTTKLYIYNGRIIQGMKEYYNIGDEVTVKCNAGFTLLGQSTASYIGGNKWSPTIPTCTLSVFLRLLIAACLIPVVMVTSKIVHKNFCSEQSLTGKREQKSTAATREDTLLPETLKEATAKFEQEHQKENGRQQEKLESLTNPTMSSPVIQPRKQQMKQ